MTHPQMRRRARLLAPLAIVALLLTGCNANARDRDRAEAGGDGAPVKGGTMTILDDSTVLEVDPGKSYQYAQGWMRLFHRGLTTWKQEGDAAPEVVPDLATDTGVASDGGRTWTYTLKDGLQYSNGEPITAEDVKHGVERTFDAAIVGGLGYHKGLLANSDDYAGPYSGKHLDSIETPDAKTVVFRLSRPFGDFPWIASMPAFSPVPEAADTDPARYGEKPVSSGPYMVESNDGSKRLVAVRNPHWGEDDNRTAMADRIVVEGGLSAETIVGRLIEDRGEDASAFTYVGVPASSLQRVQQDPGVKARLAGGSGNLLYLALNTRRPALKEPAVRQAIAAAVDKTAVQVAFGGPTIGGAIAQTMIPPGINGYEKPATTTPAGGDTALARQLLGQAGASGLKLTMLVNSTSSAEVAVGEAMQAALGKAGITVQLRQLDGDAWYSESTGEDGDYDLTLTNWQADYPNGAGALQLLFSDDQIGNGGFNMSRYTTAELQSAIDSAVATTDPAESDRQWAAIDRQLMSAVPAVPLLNTRTALLRGSNIAGYRIASFPPYPNVLRMGLADPKAD